MKNLTDVDLVRGTPMLITGPTACGKSRLAQAIARRHGSFREVPGALFSSQRELMLVLAEEPRTVIVDEPPRRLADWVKELITSQEVAVRKPYAKAPSPVRTPDFIFCAQEADWFRDDSARRFWIVKLDANGNARFDA